MNLEIIGPALDRLAKSASVPVALHLDHGLTFPTIIRALRNGFSGIMFDVSMLDFEKNIEKSA